MKCKHGTPIGIMLTDGTPVRCGDCFADYQTDSCYSTAPRTRNISSHQLGAWKYEGELENWIGLAPKTYGYYAPEDGHVDSGGLEVRATGASGSIPMLLWCPVCHERHVDEGEYATKPHHTHACQTCGMVWRPALVNTVGVGHLPGFKNR